MWAALFILIAEIIGGVAIGLFILWLIGWLD